MLIRCRWPFRQVAPLLGTCDEDVDRAWPMPPNGSSEMLRKPVKGLFHNDSYALGRKLNMGPRADGQSDIDAAASCPLVLLEHLINERILPAILQQEGDVDPLERLTQPHRSPQGVLGIRRRKPLPVRHPACEDRFLSAYERKLLESRLETSARRHATQDAPDQTDVQVLEALKEAQCLVECEGAGALLSSHPN